MKPSEFRDYLYDKLEAGETVTTEDVQRAADMIRDLLNLVESLRADIADLQRRKA
jgi:hypothetical protein